VTLNFTRSGIHNAGMKLPDHESVYPKDRSLVLCTLGTSVVWMRETKKTHLRRARINHANLVEPVKT